MKRLVMVFMVCLYIVCPYILGYCQEDTGANLDSEIRSEANEGASEEATANAEFNAGEPVAP
ncbi:MAG: hypothetical protein PHF11_07665 [Candidatus Omnitrophica bacterium]|nr:hypothetical protein [Candidatus Omnitrophota bacterium]